MRAVTHRDVPDRVGEALLDWLPAAEFAVSLRDVADRCVEVADTDGGVLAVALLVEGRPTLSGAEALAACAAAEPAAAVELGAGIAPLAVAAQQLEVVGPAGVARPLAEEVARRTSGRVSVVMEQRLMVATEVAVPTDVPGAGRPVTEQDHPTVAQWVDDFAVEALGAEPRGAEHWLERLPETTWQPWLWEVDGTPVSLVNGRGTTPVSSRLGPVYTPPPLRGRGYASALTAHVASVHLEEGDTRVTLFTDETNPTSNAVYARVGFVDVGAHGSWLVET